jgi:hypothetical protein
MSLNVDNRGLYGVVVGELIVQDHRNQYMLNEGHHGPAEQCSTGSDRTSEYMVVHT